MKQSAQTEQTATCSRHSWGAGVLAGPEPLSSAGQSRTPPVLGGRLQRLEFADLALWQTLRANERTRQRAPLAVRADWPRGPRGWPGAAAGGGGCGVRVGVARAPRRPGPPRSAPAFLRLPPCAPRLRPRAGGAPHCTLSGHRSVRGMGQRTAAGGRNPRAARVSSSGLPGRAQKGIGLMPAAPDGAGPGPSPGSGLSLWNCPLVGGQLSCTDRMGRPSLCNPGSTVLARHG